MKALHALRALLVDEEGATLVEYALVLSLLSIATAMALNTLGGSATSALDTDSSALLTAGENPP